MNIPENIKVSVIVPVFNAEKYIQQCINSIREQVLEEIEIIVVDDGSSDKSWQLLQEMASCDQRVKLFRQENKGVSAARNKGIEMARGEFIGFVDADDWIDPNMYYLLYQNIILYHAEIGICNAYNLKPNSKNVRLPNLGDIASFEFKPQESIRELMQFKYDYAIWNKLYSKNIIQNNGLKFSQTLVIYEDLLFNLEYWGYCKRAAIVNMPLYYYRIHDNSVMATNKKMAMEQYDKMANEFRSICLSRKEVDTLNAFQTEIRRGFFHNHLPILIKRVQNQKVSFWRKVEILSRELKNISAINFEYKKSEMKGFQFFKKGLLKTRKFYLFSLLELFRLRLFTN